MPIEASKNSGWIFDSWEPTTEETSNNPNEAVLTTDLAAGEHYMRYIWSYQRHMVVQSPDNFVSVFNQKAQPSQITSASGDRQFQPVVFYNKAEVANATWICVRERLTTENAGDGTFRLEQEFQVISKWELTKEFIVDINPPATPADRNEADADPHDGTETTFPN